MNNFRDGGFRSKGKDLGGRGKFGGSSAGRGERPRTGGFSGGDRGGRPQRQSELFKATCSACHKSCEVPFRPSGDKPVFCSACFNKKERNEERGGGRDYGSRSDSRTERPEYAQPRREYASKREETPRIVRDSGLEDVKRQLATIESRLNRILDLLNPPTPPTKTKADAVEVAMETEHVNGDVLVEALPKKVRKPKTVKTPAKKIAKKAVKKAAKKVVKR